MNLRALFRLNSSGDSSGIEVALGFFKGLFVLLNLCPLQDSPKGAWN
jgi:hypothetical protein